MSLFPVVAGAALVQFGTAAGSAATTMASGFLKMLEAAVEKGTSAATSAASTAASTAGEASQSAGSGLAETLDPDALRERLASLLSTFRDCVSGTLGEHGVPFDQGLRVSQSENGTLTISSDAPQSGAATEALNASPVLKDLFSAIVQASQKLQGAVSTESGASPTRPLQVLVSPDGATAF